MDVVEAPAWMQLLGLQGESAPSLYASEQEINELAPVQHAHIMRQAFRHLELTAIICVDGKPLAYIKEISTDTLAPVPSLHQKAWSQGVAALLIVITPVRVLVFSCLTLPTRDPGALDKQGRLIETLERTVDALRILEVSRSMRLGTYFDAFERSYDYKKSFNPRLRVDRYLLSNLNAARKALEDVSPTAFDRRAVHRLLGRVIFACYFVDRGIVGSDYFKSIGFSRVSSLQEVFEGLAGDPKHVLFTLFARLRDDFNGDMLAGDLESEQHAFNDQHISILRSLLRGDNLVEKQPTLGFWAYDFSIIPIETISAIYESFLEADDPKAKKKVGAYYTPRFLCEAVLDHALSPYDTLLGKRFLDPSCGSGIFLVSIFNRIAEEWRRKFPSADNVERFTALKKIVQDSIFGIDMNETACRIAALSMYLAILDQLDPKEILQLPPKALPPLVRPIEDVGVEYGLNIVFCDFFSDSLPPDLGDFDLVIGNPPWVRSKDSRMETWRIENNLPVSQGQMAQGFIWKALEHARANGRVCFLLPAGVLFNTQKSALQFQRRWLSRATIASVLNFADLRFYLFENAIRPAIAVCFGPGVPPANHRVNYLVPKTDPETLRAELMILGADDVHSIKLDNVLDPLSRKKVPLEWKRRMWATPRDREFLERLDALPRLDDCLNPESRRFRAWIAGEGYQPLLENDDPKSGKPNVAEPKDLFLPGRTKGLHLLLLEQDCIPMASRAQADFRRQGADVFDAPHVIVSQGHQVAYAGFPVYFQSVLRAIRGMPGDEDELMFLAAVLDSDVMRYYLFHTSANWGVERDKVLFDELRQIPFFIPSASETSARVKFENIAALMNATLQAIESGGGRTVLVKELRQSLQLAVNQFFGIDDEERALIKDTLSLWEPSSLPNRNSRVRTYETTTTAQRAFYVQSLRKILNHWQHQTGKKVVARVLTSRALSMGVVELKMVGVDFDEAQALLEEESSPELEQCIERVRRSLSSSDSTLRQVRNLKIFLDSHLYLFKPLSRRYWAPSIAMEDADEIAAAILRERSGPLE